MIPLNGRESLLQKGTLAPSSLLNIFFNPSSGLLSYLKLFNLFYFLVVGVCVLVGLLVLVFFRKRFGLEERRKMQINHLRFFSTQIINDIERKRIEKIEACLKKLTIKAVKLRVVISAHETWKIKVYKYISIICAIFSVKNMNFQEV